MQYASLRNEYSIDSTFSPSDPICLCQNLGNRWTNSHPLHPAIDEQSINPFRTLGIG